MAAIPPRRSGRTAHLQRTVRRRTRTAPRRPAAPIGSRPPGRRRIPAPISPADQQQVVAAPADRWTRIQQAAGTLAALGTLAAIIFTWLSIQQVDQEHAITREGQVTDRYNAAVGNIGDDSLEVRLGGIYALQRIMEDSPRDQPSIVNVLSTYIRSHAKPEQEASASSKQPTLALASDVQAALTALASRDSAHDGTAHVDLTGADLTGAYLYKANLKGVNLNGTNLRKADMRGADLTFSDLNGASLRSANLNEAILHGTHLSEADLKEANLSYAELRGAVLDEANLQGANLSNADLNNADLIHASLTGAFLTKADLTSAVLYEADLSDADLREAVLRDTVIEKADLRGADLTDVKR
ncbi:pentapeptide repeat-containing protein [Streptomyces abyssomicinicus]|uniref:pentapeptide repeat-containing protein n=1 Tax=Streptomyces abyssomicinicus TaxID=574929 RepID=UPI0012509137|nr:pentapeptide repeat-containing protein [Streptomyces abyssomicinicus]